MVVTLEMVTNPYALSIHRFSSTRATRARTETLERTVRNTLCVSSLLPFQPPFVRVRPD